MTSPFTLLLQREDVPFELELSTSYIGFIEISCSLSSWKYV